MFHLWHSTRTNNHIISMVNELIRYRSWLYEIEMTYRIHKDEGTLRAMQFARSLHDTVLRDLRQAQAQMQHVTIKDDTDFEQALLTILS